MIIIFKKDELLETKNNPEYQEYISEYKQIVDEKVKHLVENNENFQEFNFAFQAGNSKGTVGNFEGPQVHLKAIKFHDEILDTEDGRLLHIDAVSAHFDPDHPFYGLPDVKISIQDVRLFKQSKSNISKFFNFGNDEPKPYKVYRKRIKTDSLGIKSKILVMQLWLTEFKVSIDIRPNKKSIVNITEEEKNKTTYPGFWYGSTLPRIKLKDLKKEYKDNRYGDISFILKVIPNNSPVYYQSKNSKTTKADFAIAAIYCNEAKIGNEPKIQRISTNIHTGQPVFLNNQFDYDQMNNNNYGFSDNVKDNAQKILDIKANNSNYIWNKPYYLKLYFNNLGTWRNGIFSQNEYHDQVIYKFVMPIFVVGSWDIIAPQEILPDWLPPEPYIRKITLKNFLPFWNLGFIGKTASIIFVISLIFIGSHLIFPSIITSIKRITHYNK